MEDEKDYKRIEITDSKEEDVVIEGKTTVTLKSISGKVVEGLTELVINNKIRNLREISKGVYEVIEI